MIDYKQIADNVLSAAVDCDPGMERRYTPKQLARVSVAWARVFEQSGVVWPKEAVEAVFDHYGKDSFSIRPVDVVNYCKQQQPWSSRDHAASFVDKWTSRPFSRVIQTFSGLHPPEGYDEEQFQVWVLNSREEIIDGIITTKHFDSNYKAGG